MDGLSVQIDCSHHYSDIYSCKAPVRLGGAVTPPL